MRLRLLAALAVTVALGGSAHAAKIDFSGSLEGNVTFAGSSLGSATSLTFSSPTWLVTGTGLGDQSGLTALSSTVNQQNGSAALTLSTSNPVDWVKTWQVGSVDYTETLNKVTSVVNGGASSITVDLSGELSIVNGSSTIVQAATETIVATSAGGSISASFSNHSVSAPGPVPGTGFAGLAALALAGLYTRARRA